LQCNLWGIQMLKFTRHIDMKYDDFSGSVTS
jgi:hypothetical protein